MPLNTLTLGVTSGVIGRPFRARVNGVTAGSSVVIANGSALGFGYSNGFVTHPSLPQDLQVVRLTERKSGDEVVTSEIAITAVSEFASRAAASLAGGTSYRAYAALDANGNAIWSSAYQAPGGALVAAPFDGGSTPTPTPNPDTTPDAFSFADQTNVVRSTEITSAPVTITGINQPASWSVTGGTAQVGSGPFAGTGTVAAGETMRVRLTSSASYNTVATATLTVGGVSDAFSVTTLAEPVVTPTNEFLFADGATTVAYHNATQPVAEYAPSTNRTWFISEAGNDNNQRISRMYAFDNATGYLDGPSLAFVSAITDDDHGVGSIAVDTEGYIWAFGGIHNGGVGLRVSVSIAPDVNVFRPLAPLDLITDCYPHPTVVGSTMYLFARQGAASDRLELALVKGAISAGNVTWAGSRTFITNWGADNRVYQGNYVKRGTDILIPLVRANRNDENRRNPALIVYNTMDGSVRSLDGTINVPEADLPLNASQLYACRIRAQAGDVAGSIPQIVIHQDVIHAFFGEGFYDGAGDSGENNTRPFNLLWSFWDASLNGGLGAWSPAVKVGDMVGRYSSNTCPVSYADRLEVVFMDGSGNMAVVTRPNSTGVWSTQTTFKEKEREYRLGGPGEVRYAAAGTPRLTFSEKGTLGGVTDAEVGDLRIYTHDGTKFYKRNNSGALWTPQELGDKLLHWFRPATFTDGDTNWTDMIRGNSFGAVSDPAIVNTFAGNKRAIDFDGNDAFARSTRIGNAAYGSVGSEIWAVASVPTGKSGYLFAYGDAGAQRERRLRLPSAGNLAISTGVSGQEITSTGTFNNGTPFIARGRFDTNALTLYANAVQLATNDISASPLNTSSTGNHRARIAANAGTTTSGFLTGQIQHVIGTALLTADEAARLEGWLAWDSGLQANLPAGHPYKSAAPTVA